MKKHLPTIIMVLIFLIGLSLFLYPTVSNLYNEYLNSRLIDNYEDTMLDVSEDIQAKLLEEAKIYNENLFSPEKLEELGLKYDNMLSINGNNVMGYLEIPKISTKLVIYHSTDESLLQDGVGHVLGTALPIGGQGTHCALAGHRGLPSAKLLTNLDYLNKGDIFYIKVLKETLTYRIDDISVVEPDDTSRLKPVSGEDYVTLVTCTPYGINSHRLLVRGRRVNSNSANYSANIVEISNDLFDIEPIYIIPAALIFLLILAIIIKKVREKRTTVKKARDKNHENTDET